VRHESLGGDDLHRAGVHLLLGGHAEDTAEVIDVTVGVNDRDHGTRTAVLPVQGECRGGCLAGDQRVDDDDPGVPLDERDVREVEPAHLIDPGHDFEQTVPRGKRGLTPQTRVHGCRRLALHEGVTLPVPDDAAIGIRDHERIERAEEAALRGNHVPIISERQGVQGERMSIDDGRCRIEEVGHGLSVDEVSDRHKGRMA
jgi:hypothetical protein